MRHYMKDKQLSGLTIQLAYDTHVTVPFFHPLESGSVMVKAEAAVATANEKAAI